PRDLIDAVVENMRQNLEILKYSTLAPSRYTVYLHPAEHARLEGIVPILQEQTIRALTEELARLNRSSSVRRWADRLARRSRAAPLPGRGAQRRRGMAGVVSRRPGRRTARRRPARRLRTAAAGAARSQRRRADPARDHRPFRTPDDRSRADREPPRAWHRGCR